MEFYSNRGYNVYQFIILFLVMVFAVWAKASHIEFLLVTMLAIFLILMERALNFLKHINRKLDELIDFFE